LQAGAARTATPWATVAVGWYGGQRNTLWVFSRLARWSTPVESWPGVVRRWAGGVTCAEGRAHLDVATPRPRSDRAIARPTPVLLARFSLVTVRALKLSRDRQMPVPVTAW
jgi:hypothetical protein